MSIPEKFTNLPAEMTVKITHHLEFDLPPNWMLEDEMDSQSVRLVVRVADYPEGGYHIRYEQRADPFNPETLVDEDDAGVIFDTPAEANKLAEWIHNFLTERTEASPVLETFPETEKYIEVVSLEIKS